MGTTQTTRDQEEQDARIEHMLTSIETARAARENHEAAAAKLRAETRLEDRKFFVSATAAAATLLGAGAALLAAGAAIGNYVTAHQPAPVTQPAPQIIIIPMPVQQSPLWPAPRY